MCGNTPTISISRTAGLTSSRRFSTTSSIGTSPRKTWQRRSNAYLTSHHGDTEAHISDRGLLARTRAKTPALRDSRGVDSQMHAGIEQDRGIGPVAHAERLGARETAQRDVARRCLPGARMRLFPTEMA